MEETISVGQTINQAVSKQPSKVSEKSRILKGGVIVAIGYGFGLVLSFLRNLVLARLIGPEELGIATTFALVMSILEAASNLSWDKLVIQSPHGDEKRFVNTAHSLMLLRGLFTGVLLYFFAGQIAGAFGVPQAMESYQYLALLPLFNGAAHLDIKRFQRNYLFHYEIYTNITAHACGLIAAFVCAWWLGDHRAMLIAVLVQGGIICLVSHRFAKRSYGLEWDYKYALSMFHFGWPLMLNGLLLLAAAEGDKLLIGVSFEMTDLAIYAMAALVIGSPAAVIRRVVLSIGLPSLSRIREDNSRFVRRFNLLGFAVTGAAMLIGIPACLIGTELIALVFGEDYRGAEMLVAWLALAHCSQTVRAWSFVAAFSQGDSRNVLYANVFRVSGIGMAVVFIQFDFSYLYVAASMAFGEIIATIVSLWLVTRYLECSKWNNFRIYFVVVFAFAIAIGVLAVWGSLDMVVSLVLTLLLLMGAFIFLVLLVGKDGRNVLVIMKELMK